MRAATQGATVSNPPTSVLAAPSEPTCVSSPLFSVPGDEPQSGPIRRRRLAAVLVAVAGLVAALLVVVGGGVDANTDATVGGAVLGDDGIVTVTAGGDIIANGVVQAAKDLDLQVPLVVRLEGTNVDQGKAILADSGMNIIPADDLDDAAQKIVAAVKGA